MQPSHGPGHSTSHIDCRECDRLLKEHTTALVEFQERLDAYRADLAVITDEDELLPMREHIDHLRWRVERTREAFLAHEETHDHAARGAPRD